MTSLPNPKSRPSSPERGMKPWFFVALMPLLVLAAPSRAQGQDQTEKPAVPSLPVRYAATAPAVTADPNEGIWKTAASTEKLGVADGEEATVADGYETQVRALWDAQYLYLRFQGQNEDGFSPHGTQHDATHYEGSVVEVFLDCRGDSREVVELQVNPQGGVFDGVHLLTAAAAWDEKGVLKPDVIAKNAWFFSSWDIDGLRTASHVENKVWTTDVALPASLLKHRGLKAFTALALRANFIRYVHPLLADGTRGFVALNWSRVPLGRPHRALGALGNLQLVVK